MNVHLSGHLGRAAACLIVLLLCGCMRQYASPRFDPEDVVFKGIASYLSDAPKVRVVFVHGMCTHHEDWINSNWDGAIQKTLAMQTQAEAASSPAEFRTKPYQVIPKTYSAGTKQLDARFILWSPATAALKQTLHYDNRPKDEPPGHFQWRRAVVNGKIKAGLINDCFSDAVIYAGQYGQTLREVMKAAICEAFDLQYHAASSTCDLGEGTANGESPTLLVTESLGSRIVFDALLELTASDRSPALQRILARMPQVYMLANQLPLLELAGPAGSSAENFGAASPDHIPGALSPAQDSTIDRFAQLLIRSRKEERTFKSPSRALRPAQGAEIALIAFTDPNDLLSYRLDPKRAPEGVHIANVLASNAGTILGLVENPMPAHQGHKRNARVMELILCGRRVDGCKTLREERAP